MTTQPLVETLDSRYGKHHSRWCIYRAECGLWVVLISNDGGHSKSITGATIEDALNNAVAFVPLPEIPRRPVIMDLHQFEPRKSGKSWHLYYQDSFYGVLKSKRQCIKMSEKLVLRSKEDQQKWDCQYSGFLSKREGVDFAYKV